MAETTDGLTFRDVTVADAAAVTEIYNQSILGGNATMDQEPWSEEETKRLIKGFDKREALLLLERNTEILGWGIIKKYSDRAGYRFACETAVYLRHEEVGRGYGSRIKRALIERAKQLGYHHLVAKVFTTNVPSIEYNKKFGYEIVGVQREIGYQDGRWIDVVIMQLVLDGA